MAGLYLFKTDVVNNHNVSGIAFSGEQDQIWPSIG